MISRPQSCLRYRFFLVEVHIILMLLEEIVLGELLDQVFHYCFKVELGCEKLRSILCCLSLVLRLLFLV